MSGGGGRRVQATQREGSTPPFPRADFVLGCFELDLRRCLRKDLYRRRADFIEMRVKDTIDAAYRYLITRIIYKCNAIGAASPTVRFSCNGYASFLSQDFLTPSGNLLLSKSLGFVPVVALHFLHGDLVTSQCLCVLLFRCKPSHEQQFDNLK